MGDESRIVENAEHYRSMGMVANPFTVREERPGAARATLLEMQAESNRLIATLVAAAQTDRSSVVWVSKSNDIAGFFHMFAESDAEQRMLVDDSLGMLPCYVQLYMARVGRIRSALNVLAERLATRSFELTLVELVRVIADGPDTSLPEWAALDPAVWHDFSASFERDALATVREHFGEFVLQRSAMTEPPVTDIREISLDPEPEESDDTAETDVLTEAVPATGAVPQTEHAEAPDPRVLLRAFLIAHTRAHFSPVIARGLKAYADSGFGQMIVELKITQAPRKTLKALMNLAALRFGTVVFLYDGLENWQSVPEELQVKYVAALAEIRTLAGKHGAMVFLAEEGVAPELEDQFGIGQRFTWAFPHLVRINERPDVYDAEAVQWWLDCVTIPGRELHLLGQNGWPVLVEAAGGDMERFCTIAAEAVERVATGGHDVLDDETARAVLASMPSASV